MLDPPFQSVQRPTFNSDAHPFTNSWSQAHPELGVQCFEDVLQLALESSLIEHIEKICDVIILADGRLLAGLQLKEYVARKQRFLEHDSFAAVLMGRVEAWQRGHELIAAAEFNQLLFAPCVPMRYVPMRV